MNTPRSGLIRATEGAIKEYIRDGCAENLPLIRQLEDVAFQFWVESNTSFLNETIETVEDEDDWIWDEEYLFQSFTGHADDKLIDAIDDSNSSICSSIKPCDETDCSFGYLASCEDNNILDLSEIENWDLLENNVSDVHVTENVDYENKRNKHDNQTESIHCLSTKLNKTEIVNDISTNGDTSYDNRDRVNDDMNITESGNTNEDEWVVVTYDMGDCVPSSEWFIVSVNETSESAAETMSMRQTSPVDVNHSSSEQNVKKLNDNATDDIAGAFDISEWAVLSMRISEINTSSDKQEIDKKQADFSPRFESHDIMEAYKQTEQMEFIQGALGLKKQSSCEKHVDRCPLCRNRKENYKCAIFCLLLE